MIEPAAFDHTGTVAIEVRVGATEKWLFEFKFDFHASLTAIQISLCAIEKYNGLNFVELRYLTVENRARRQARLILDAVTLRRVIALRPDSAESERAEHQRQAGPHRLQQ